MFVAIVLIPYRYGTTKINKNDVYEKIREIVC